MAYTWDPEDRLTSVTTPDGTVWRYLYDPLGRRIAKLRLGGDGSEGSEVVERTDFTWDGMTVTEQVTSTADASHAVALTWDHDGPAPVAQTERKLPAAGADSEGGLSAPIDGGDVATPLDAMGVPLPPDSATVHLRIDAESLRPGQGSARDAGRARVGGPARASQETVDERFFAIVTDLIGTPTELVTEAGDIAWHTRTTLWGTTTWNRDATAYTPLRFPGQYFDLETELHYNYFRYYEPGVGRYLSADPLGLAPSPNPRGYVSNPKMSTDAQGLSPCDAKSQVTDLRDSGAISRKRNIAAAEISIQGRERYFLRSASGDASRPGMVDPIGSPGNMPQRYLPHSAGANPRTSDTELKILNKVANDLGPASAMQGTIYLHSELPICESCESVIEQFRRDYPNIDLIVSVN